MLRIWSGSRLVCQAAYMIQQSAVDLRSVEFVAYLVVQPQKATAARPSHIARAQPAAASACPGSAPTGHTMHRHRAAPAAPAVLQAALRLDCNKCQPTAAHSTWHHTVGLLLFSLACLLTGRTPTKLCLIRARTCMSECTGPQEGPAPDTTNCPWCWMADRPHACHLAL
jgi:hypothetical protein